MSIFKRILLIEFLISNLLIRVQLRNSLTKILSRDFEHKSFLIGWNSSTILYFDKDFIYKFDYITNEIVHEYLNYKFVGLEYDEEISFCGALFRQTKDKFFYMVAYRNAILKLTRDYFQDGSVEITYDEKSNHTPFHPRLLYRIDKPGSDPESTFEYTLTISTGAEIREYISELDEVKVQHFSNNSEQKILLLAALLKQDFDEFSSDGYSELFMEKNHLLVYSRIQANYTLHKIDQLIYGSHHFLKMIGLFSSVIFVVSLLFDYFDPYKYDLDSIILHFVKQGDLDFVRFCTHQKTKNEDDEVVSL